MRTRAVRGVMKRYTVAQAAAKMRRNPILVYRWLQEGRLKGEKFGHAWLVSATELQRLMRAEPGRRRRPQR